MKDDNSTLVLTDMMGNIVKQFIINNLEFTINIADLAEGVYTISIINSVSVLTKKVIISK
jgi:type IX secretion system substrate protein